MSRTFPRDLSSQSYDPALGGCGACDQDGICGYSLATYQYWFAVCSQYASLEGGESAALSLAAQPTQQVVEYYSTTLLPLVQSILCGQMAVATTPMISTSAVSIASSQPTAATTASASPVSTSSGHGLMPVASLFGLPAIYMLIFLCMVG